MSQSISRIETASQSSVGVYIPYDAKDNMTDELAHKKVLNIATILLKENMEPLVKEMDVRHADKDGYFTDEIYVHFVVYSAESDTERVKQSIQTALSRFDCEIYNTMFIEAK